jgi:Ca2+-binding EF-hand superfamily protein
MARDKTKVEEGVPPPPRSLAGQLLGELFDSMGPTDGLVLNHEASGLLQTIGCMHVELYSDLQRSPDSETSRQQFISGVLRAEQLDMRGYFAVEIREKQLRQELHGRGPASMLVGALFETVDVDGSGYMEAEEGSKFFGVMGYRQEELEGYWSDLLRAADSNGDGKISKGEFVTYILGKEELDSSGGLCNIERHQRLQAQLAIVGPAGKAISQLFDSVDADANGYLDRTESRKFLLATGCAQTELEYRLSDLLRFADSDGDGRVSKQEFLAYVAGQEELDERGQFKNTARSEQIAAQVASITTIAKVPPPLQKKNTPNSGLHPLLSSADSM